MNDRMINDTIVAISTPIGESGIGIVRMSGGNSFPIAKKIFIPSKKTKIDWSSSFKIHYGWIVDPESGERIDEVLLTLMRTPRTYTKEDIVEINCHGGLVALRKTLEICMNLGARLAEPGEFTKRAFLNGRIDLAQAESVLDIVQAKTEKSLQLAIKGLKGELSGRILSLKKKIIELLSFLEAEINFSQEDIEFLSREDKEKYLNSIFSSINSLLEAYKTGMIYREGVRAVIVGKTNVGKSSLFNALVQRERAIVTHIPGTTRDTIEEVINVNGFPLRLIDTAGLREVKDLVEKEGVKRAYSTIEEADIVLLMLDGSTLLNKEDKMILNKVEYLLSNGIKKKNLLVLINKVDLPLRIDKEKVKSFFPKESLIEISATKGTNLEKLKQQISQLILKKVSPSSDSLLINIRQRDALRLAKESISRAIEGLRQGLSEEFLSIDVREGLEHLKEITGEVIGDEILDNIFSNFCIGK